MSENEALERSQKAIDEARNAAADALPDEALPAPASADPGAADAPASAGPNAAAAPAEGDAPSDGTIDNSDTDAHTDEPGSED